MVGAYYAIPLFSISKTSIALTGILTLLMVYYGVTILWSPATTYAIRKSYLVSIRIPILVLFSVLVIVRDKYRTRLFYLITLGVSLIITVILSHIYISNGEILSSDFVNYYITVNRVLGIGAVLSVFLGLRYEKLRFRVLAGIVLLLNLFFMTQTGGRGPLIATIVAILAYFGWITILRRDKSEYLVRFSTALGGGCLFLSIIIIELGGRTISRLTRLANGPGNSVMGRINMAEASVNLFAQKPIFGHGAGAFQMLYVDPFQYPHNIFLEFLVESGIIGLLLFITYIVYILLIIVRYGRKDVIYSGIILSLFIFFLLNAFVSADIPGNDGLFIYSITALSLVESK
ncbi:O-antigen ligase family protein [Haloplanus rubicundus]|nr:O-antigen ligase family protein [Haloplanus rubicundus]